MVGLLVEEKRGIAEHAHILQAAQDTFLVDFREPALPFPLTHQSGQNVILFPIWFRPLRGQRDWEYLVRAVRQILQYLSSRTPQQDRRQLFVNAVQTAI